MNEKEIEFQKRLLATFKIEAEEHVKEMSADLLKMEENPPIHEQNQIIEKIFREAHSLKGAARAVNLLDIEKICHALETVFDSVKHKGFKLSEGKYDILHNAVDCIGRILVSPQKIEEIFELVRRIEELASGECTDENLTERCSQKFIEESLSTNAKEASTENKITDTAGAYINDDKRNDTNNVRQKDDSAERETTHVKVLRVAATKLDTLFFKAEEMLSLKQVSLLRAHELSRISAIFNDWDNKWSKAYSSVRKTFSLQNEIDSVKDKIKRSSADIDSLIEFLEWNNNYIKILEKEINDLAGCTKRDHRMISGMVDEFLEDVKKIIMMPFSSVLESFPKAVRDISRNQGKNVNLLIQGGEVEIDKRILEEIKDPLMHMVRNCIDHGIENTEVRVQKNKKPQGTISLSIHQTNSNQVEIVISDDGRGINVEKVKKAALKSGYTKKEDIDNMDDKEALSLIFQSDISTSPIITNISGRGLGLAIVREKAEKLGGKVNIESGINAGTTFRIILPLTLATFRGIIVRVADQKFAIPTISVEQVIRVNTNEIKEIEEKETVFVDGESVPLIKLSDVLCISSVNKNISKEIANSDYLHTVVISASNKCIAFSVDEVLDEQEVLVKNLGKQLVRVRNIAGATILGSGEIIPVINVYDLIQSAIRTPSSSVTKDIQRETTVGKRKMILIVEDSITSRMLLKNILESGGYNVKTAVDGIDGLSKLKMEEFDLVVSDVDMPRMNGFALTAKIRENKKLSEIPVILVTSLGSREDCERGIDVGASAYIVKSNFDQSDLLETVKRFI
ncbi:MAG: hybrid sensor histidine kinase/response regulator [Candidatus Kuenenia sp.]|nr:hybrid sensor histidine kinase/response regulator [Candidatus Kuenenia hertensis]